MRKCVCYFWSETAYRALFNGILCVGCLRGDSKQETNQSQLKISLVEVFSYPRVRKLLIGVRVVCKSGFWSRLLEFDPLHLIQ